MTEAARPPTSAGDPGAADSGPRLSDLPADELLQYGRDLGLSLEHGLSKGELTTLIRARQELILQVDRDAMLEIVVWARHPVRQSAGKEHLARVITKIQRTDYERLSRRGLAALARLRGLPAAETDTADALIERLRRSETIGGWLRRVRRSIAASVLSQYVDQPAAGAGEGYRFLPEDKPARGSLKSEIEQRGIVGGLASRLRGAADNYVSDKLDEIEARIDRKLDEIDARLSEWRDREVQNRLKIIRITLTASVIVAVLSLVYKYVSSRVADEPSPAAATMPAASGPGSRGAAVRPASIPVRCLRGAPHHGPMPRSGTVEQEPQSVTNHVRKTLTSHGAGGPARQSDRA